MIMMRKKTKVQSTHVIFEHRITFLLVLLFFFFFHLVLFHFMMQTDLVMH